MIEWAMIFWGGFLVACLLALMLSSVVHDRAVRLTRRRLEVSIPESLAELQADKDHLRAHFAISMHRLERSVEELRFKATIQLNEIEHKREVINRLRTELARRTEVADELAHKVESVTGNIGEVERERQRNAIEAVSIERALSAKEVEFVRQATEQRFVIDTQRAEIATLNAQIEQSKTTLLQQHADYIARRTFDEPMETLAIIKELEEEYWTSNSRLTAMTVGESESYRTDWLRQRHRPGALLAKMAIDDGANSRVW
jgi:chromosome segregation ATPase